MMKALPPSLISTQSGVSSAESDAPAGSPELQPWEKNTLRRRLIGHATMATGSALGTNAWRRTASTRLLDAPLTTPVADATGSAMDAGLREQVCGGNAAALWRA